MGRDHLNPDVFTAACDVESFAFTRGETVEMDTISTISPRLTAKIPR